MKTLLVFGDSFCANRQNFTDWPNYLAKQLNLRLTGQGFSGASWWEIRKSFLQILRDDFENIELIVFCHAWPHRIIGVDKTVNHHDPANAKIVKTYLTHFSNDEFDHWCCQQWFKELNSLVTGKKIIHIQNFQETKKYFHSLQGIRLETPTLIELSMAEIGSKYTTVLVNDCRSNHFSAESNLKLGNFLAKVYVDNQKNWTDKAIQITL